MKMPKKQQDEFEDEFDEEDVEEEEPKSPRRISRPKQEKSFTPKQSKNLYSAYHYPQTDGIVNNETGKIITTDIWDALTMILNDLNELKRLL